MDTTDTAGAEEEFAEALARDTTMVGVAR